MLPVKHCIYKTEGWEIVPELRKIDLLHCDQVRNINKNTFGYTNWYEQLPYKDTKVLRLNCVEYVQIFALLVMLLF